MNENNSGTINYVNMPEAKHILMGDIKLRPFAGDELMLVRVEAPENSIAPDHEHPHEQMSVLLTGRAIFRMDGKETLLVPGDAVRIPSNTTHGATFVEASVMFDIFTPIREDFLAALS